MKYRIEFDSIGKIKVPGDKYWGASTERSNKYFNIGDFLVRPIVIHSIAIIKKAAAIINAKNKDLDKKLSKYIVKAAEEIIKGKLNIQDFDYFGNSRKDLPIWKYCKKIIYTNVSISLRKVIDTSDLSKIEVKEDFN